MKLFANKCSVFIVVIDVTASIKLRTVTLYPLKKYWTFDSIGRNAEHDMSVCHALHHILYHMKYDTRNEACQTVKGMV